MRISSEIKALSTAAWLRRGGAAALIAMFATAGAQTVPSAISGSRPTAATQDYVLGPGDVIKISVFQNPDLTLETRVSENGTITYPLIGAAVIGGSSTSIAERHIARMLKEGGFLVNPQVTIMLEQIHGNQVAALGQFNHAGRFPLDTTQTKLSDLIAQAGGIAPTGSDTVILAGRRDGKSYWQKIDVGDMFVRNHLEHDFILQAGDVLFVDRFPVFYIYGEVQRPGPYRVERNMTVVQALATGGGLTPRGTQRGLRIKRRDAAGQMVELKPELDDQVKAEDVIFLRESVF